MEFVSFAKIDGCKENVSGLSVPLLNCYELLFVLSIYIHVHWLNTAVHRFYMHILFAFYIMS